MIVHFVDIVGIVDYYLFVQILNYKAFFFFPRRY